MNRAACILVALLGLVAIGRGALAQAGGGGENEGRAGSVTLPDQLELARLVDLAAASLGISVEYDAAALRQMPITLRLAEALEPRELWLLVNRLLAARGLTTVRPLGDDVSYAVVKLTDAAGVARIEAIPGEASGVAAAARVEPGFRVVSVRVEYRSGRDALEWLKPFAGRAGASVAEVGGTRRAGAAVGGQGGAAAASVPADAAIGATLLIADLTPRVDEMLRVLRAFDRPGPALTLTEVRLRNAAPAAMLALLESVRSKQEGLGGGRPAGEVVASAAGNGVIVIASDSDASVLKGLIEQLDAREPFTTLTYATRYFAPQDVAALIEQTVREEAKEAASAPRAGWRLVIDPLTGSLVVTASAAQHEQIAALIARLDSLPAATRRPVRTYVIRNRPVREVMAVIQDLAAQGVLAAGASAAESGPGGESGDSALRPASNLGSLVNTPPAVSPATPASAAPASAASARPRARAGEPHAGLSGGGARVTAGGSGERGGLSLSVDEATNTLIAVGEPMVLAQMETLLRGIDIRQAQVMVEVLLLSVTDSQTLALGIELERLTTAGDAQIRLASLFGLSTLSGGVRGAGDGQGGTLTVISPGDFSIIVRALETLNEGRSLSMPKLLVGNNQQGQFSSTLQQPVSTTVTPSSQVTTTSFGGYEPAGTTVSVQPQIAEGDHLTVRYSVALSSFVGTGSGSLPPPRQENSLSSQVTIPDGYTIAVGGIELNTDGKGTTQVPVLGNIPLIGELFKNRNNNDARTRFFVFLRAQVLRQEKFEDLKYLSDRATGSASIEDGFPVNRPRLIR